MTYRILVHHWPKNTQSGWKSTSRRWLCTLKLCLFTFAQPSCVHRDTRWQERELLSWLCTQQSYRVPIVCYFVKHYSSKRKNPAQSTSNVLFKAGNQIAFSLVAMLCIPTGRNTSYFLTPAAPLDQNAAKVASL